MAGCAELYEGKHTALVYTYWLTFFRHGVYCTRLNLHGRLDLVCWVQYLRAQAIVANSDQCIYNMSHKFVTVVS